MLGTSIETSSVSQYKGQIERANQTFQDRLVSELRKEKITTMEAANEYLINVFIPDFNRRFALDYTRFESVMEESPALVCFKNHTECLVIVAFDKTMYVTVDDKVYLLSPIVRNHKVSKDFDQEIEKLKPIKKYIPPMTHPWKAASFRRQQQRAHQYGCYA